MGPAAEPLHVAPTGDRTKTVPLWRVHPAVGLPVGRVERNGGHLVLHGVEDVAKLAEGVVERRSGRCGTDPPQELGETFSFRRSWIVTHRAAPPTRPLPMIMP